MEAAVTGKADTAISRLFSSANSLNAVSDQISSQISEIESALIANRVGVPAWVEVARWVEGSGEYSLDYVASLGYDKHNGKWALLYGVWCDTSETHDVSFLRDTSREIRIGSLQKLPLLFDKLAEETQKLTEQATKNLADAKAITSALKANGRRQS
jgi:hypothetical protein